MWNIQSQILSAANELNVSFTELSTDAKLHTFDLVRQRFINGLAGFPLWEHLNESVSKQSQDAWRWCEDFLGEHGAVMFFNPDDEQTAFEFGSGKDVTLVLGEMFGVEFYLTNRYADFLLCFNHHDYLIASGTAKEWLMNYQTS